MIRLEGSVLDGWTQQSQWLAVSPDDKVGNWPSLTQALWTTAAAWSFQAFVVEAGWCTCSLTYSCWRKTEGTLQPQDNYVELWPRVATKAPWINPMWFFLWWYIKRKVFKTRPRYCKRHRQETWTIYDGRIITEVIALRRQRVKIRYVFQEWGPGQRHVFDVTVVMLKDVIKEINKILTSNILVQSYIW